MIDGLTFEAVGHVYRFNGIACPSVTQVLEPLQHLQGIPWAVLEEARERGTHVHEACHLLNQDDLDETALDARLARYVGSYKRFLSETGFVITASECRVFHRQMSYAGTADFFGTFRNTTWVVDIKSGVIPSTVGAQTAAYQQAATERPRRRACLQLSETDYRFVECKDLSDFSLFTSALNIFRFNQKHNPRALGAQIGDANANRISEYA